MDLITSEFVRPLKTAQSDFLEILLTRFTLEGAPGGAKLAFCFDDEVPTIWLRAGKAAVHAAIPDFKTKSTELQQRLDDILLHGKQGRLFHDDPAFPFRYASGGTLPIVRLGDREYYCLIYREIGITVGNRAPDSVQDFSGSDYIVDGSLARVTPIAEGLPVKSVEQVRKELDDLRRRGIIATTEIRQR